MDLPILQGHSSSDELTVFLQPSGRKIKTSQRDGNCLFRCFSHFLCGSESKHYTFRSILVRFENLNSQLFEKRLTEINKPTFKEHINTMLCPNEWGTHVEIMAASTYFQIPVYFCTKNANGKYAWNIVKPLCPHRQLKFPDLSGTDLPVEKFNPTHFELLYHLSHYDCVVSVESDAISSNFPILNIECSYVDEIL